jgi:hypothetical protein
MPALAVDKVQINTVSVRGDPVFRCIRSAGMAISVYKVFRVVEKLLGYETDSNMQLRRRVSEFDDIQF